MALGHYFEDTIMANISLKGDSRSVIYCCLCLFVAFLTAATTNKFPPIELQALKDLYQSTNGNNWKWKNNTLVYGIPWKFAETSPNPCGERWQGIYCTSTCTTIAPCNVEEIVLYNRNLVGTIPPTISNFSHLNYLEFSGNGLTGTLPSQLGSLHQLTQLKLSTNNFIGSLPTSLGQLILLTTLDVSYNDIGGSIPLELASLRSLQIFNLESNFFQGTIPSFYYTAYPNLTSILLCGNYFEGTISYMIKNLKKVTKIYLNSNGLKGTIPAEIGQLTHLTYLDLDTNLLTGSIPSSLTNLYQLQSLYLNDNQLNGSLPQNVTGWQMMTNLYIQKNFLSGTLPSNLGTSLPSLQVLQLCYNQLVGSIPPSFSQLKKLQALVLCNNQLQGTLPPAITTGLPQLRMLILSTNAIVGKIPSTIDQMMKLSYLYLYANQMTGQIPCSLGNLSTSLLYVDIYNNAFTGSLCDSWGKLSNLLMFSMSLNQIAGSIPNALICGSYTQLQEFYLNDNQLIGTIPDCLDQLGISMLNIALSDNALTGTIPQTLGQLINLEQVFFQNSQLHGPIPDSIGNLSNVIYVNLYNNLLSGLIPNSVGKMMKMQNVLVYTNALTGNIPDSIWSLPMIDTVAVYDNQMSGKLFTTALCTQSVLKNNLSVLDAFYNQFTGTIPCNCTLHHVVYTFIQDNYLSGNIEGFMGWTSMLILNVSDNVFTGNLYLPTTNTSIFINMIDILTIDLSNNIFSGKINNIFNHLYTLNILVLKTNWLTGNLYELFNNNHINNKQANISVIDVSDNQFTGSLPSSLFLGKSQLLSFAAVKNCFTGQIPSVICSCPQLQTLALDGLHTASTCQRRFFVSWGYFSDIDSYELVNHVTGGIPECLWNMTTLQTLHLSGNGISGSIPYDVQYGMALEEVVLSYNQLSGTIPTAMQTRSWQSLDLSFNKLSGVLDEFAKLITNGSISLSVNRLSGMIPKSLEDSSSIDVLKGNLFDCSRDYVRDQHSSSSSLPSHDEASKTYTCGTDVINNVLIVWIGCGITGTMLIIIILYLGQSSANYETYSKAWKAWMDWCKEFSIFLVECWSVSNNLALDTLEQQQTAGLFILGKNMKALRRVVMLFTAFTLLILLPIYCVLSLQYGTHTYSYAWTVSIAYCSGFIPAMIVFVIMVLFYLLIGEKVHYYIKKLRNLYVKTQESISMLEQRDESQDMPHRIAIVLVRRSVAMMQQEWEFKKIWWTVYGQYALFGGLLVLINVVVVMTVNVSYVYATSLGLSTAYQTLITLSLSIYKILWTHLVVLGIFNYFLSYCEQGVFQQKEIQLKKRFSMQHQQSTNQLNMEEGIAMFDRIQRVIILSSIVIFNSICAPFLANAFVDSNCFYYVIHTPESVSVSYNLIECYEFSVASNPILCVESFINSRSVSYIPPFNYSYQCSSSLLHDFITVFIYRYFISAFVMPCCSILWKQLREKEEFEKWKNEWIAYFVSWIIIGMNNNKLKKGDDDSIVHKKHSTNEGDIELNAVIKEIDQSESNSAINPIIITQFPDENELEHNNDDAVARNTESFLVADDCSVPVDTNNSHSPSTPACIQERRLTMHQYNNFVFSKETFMILYIGDVAVLLTFGWAFPPLALVICLSIVVNCLVKQLWLGRYIVLWKRDVVTNMFHDGDGEERHKSTIRSFSVDETLQGKKANMNFNSNISLDKGQKSGDKKHQQFALTIYQRKLFEESIAAINEDCGDLMPLFQPMLPPLVLLSTSFIAFFLFDMLGDQVGTLNALWILITMATMPIWVRVGKIIIEKSWEKIMK